MEAAPLISAEMWKIIGSAFLVIGLADIFMASFVFKKKLNTLEVEMSAALPAAQTEAHLKKLRQFKMISSGLHMMGAIWLFAGLYLITR